MTTTLSDGRTVGQPPNERFPVRLPDRPTPVLDVRGYSFWYGLTQALFDVRVAIPRRAVTALIGPSGCGKSTFLRSVKRDIPERVEHALRQAALWDEVNDRLQTPGTGLSGGQQQRLCIARALANEPEVLLMDEPCSALDPGATQRIEELLVELKRSYSIVIVTHNMQQASRASDFTGFFYLGRLMEFGPTKQLFTRPADERTEAYITGRFG